MITMAEYHMYATLFDAAADLPSHHVRINGDVAGEAFRIWCMHRGTTPREQQMVRVKDGKRVEWSMLDAPGLSVGVYLDDRPGDTEAA